MRIKCSNPNCTGNFTEEFWREIEFTCVLCGERLGEEARMKFISEAVTGDDSRD